MATPRKSLGELYDMIGDFKTEKEYNKLLRESWILTDFPNREYELWELLELFEYSTKKHLMNKKEKLFFEALPLKINVYRGLDCNKPTATGLSWTISKDKARWFADRWVGTGNVVAAQINKEDVFAVLLERDEAELVVNSDKLMEVRQC